MRSPRKSRRRPLTWYDTELGATPDCGRCLEQLLSPGFAEAVHSVSIEHAGSAADLARQAINHYHDGGHADA